MREGKVAIVTSGGGMKCAYSAGALVALARKLNITEPDIFVSASGSVGNMFYYLAHQYEEIEKTWLRYLPGSPFIRYFPLPRLYVDYLIDTIFREELPLQEEAVEHAKTRWFVPLTDLKTGKTRFLGRGTWFNLYEVMRAAKAIPYLYGGEVRLGGHTYIDGGVSTNIAALIAKAYDEGATKILVIANSKPLPPLAKLLIHIRALFSARMLRRLILDELVREDWEKFPPHVQVVVVTPSYPLPTETYTRGRRRVTEAFQMGADDLLAKRAEIEKLFV